MSRTLDVRRTLAATAAILVATWGASALPASADAAHGHSHGNGTSHSASHKGAPHKGAADKGAAQKDKGGAQKGATHTSAHQPQGPKPGKGGGKGGSTGSPAAGGNAGGSNAGSSNAGGAKGGGKGDPAGNNGTVKIAPYGPIDSIPNNTPHVDCHFQIEWYGFDEGADIISQVTFAMQAPTSDVGLSGTEPATVFVGGDPATGAGTDTGFDGVQDYTLVFDGAPHPKQGYHVKLTINTPGSQGADVKHKVFWVQPCEAPEVVGEDDETDDDDTVVEGEEETSEEDDSSSTDASVTDTEVLGEQATAPGAQVMGAQASGSVLARSGVPSAVDAGEEGNPVLDLVRSPLPLLLVGLGALLAAGAFVSRRRGSSNV